MYISRYRRCCCQKNYNNSIVESACNKCGMADNLYVEDVFSNNTMNNDNDCKCGYEENTRNVFPENPVLGQSYVPIQYMDKTFKPCVGLKMGTIFPELVSPYYPCQSMEENAFIEAMNNIGEGCNKC